MYIFYDTETTGLNKDFSQILQMGIIVTDDDMNIIAMKKVESRPSPWVVPSPGALLTTGFTPEELKKSKNSHYEMMQEVDQFIRSQYWPVTFSGYNSESYDDPILSQNLHSNLLDPKMLSAKNPSNGERNGSFDIMILVQAAHAYMPGVLKLDVLNNSGNPSMTLGNVSRQNNVGLSEDEAHDAMNDIKATVGIAKLLKKAAPQIWDQLHELSTPWGVSDFIKNHEVFTHVAYSFGKMKPAVVTSLGARQGSGMAEVLFDLNVDPAPYLKMSVEELKQAILDQNKKTPKGQPDKPEPFRMVIKSNKPIFMPMEQSDAVLPKDYSDEVMQQRLAAIKAEEGFRERVQEAAALAKAARPWPAPTWTKQPEETMWKEPKEEIKAKLDVWMKEFRDAASWKDAAKLVSEFRTRFEEELKEDPNIARFVKFAGRIVFENAPEELTVEKQEAMKKFIAQHILDENDKVPWVTIKKARAELEKIEEERADPKKKERWKEVTDTQIRSLKLYYTSLEKEYAPYLPPAAKPAAPSVDSSAPVPPTAAAPVNDNPVTPPATPEAPAADAPKKASNDTFKLS